MTIIIYKFNPAEVAVEWEQEGKNIFFKRFLSNETELIIMFFAVSHKWIWSNGSMSPLILTGGIKWRRVVNFTPRSHNHSRRLPVPIGRLHSWYCYLGTENNLLPLQGTETQFCWMPACRQVAIPTELSAASFDSAEEKRGEYTVMKQQTATGSLWIRNFTVRRKRWELKAVSPVFSGECRWRNVNYFALSWKLKITCLNSWTWC